VLRRLQNPAYRKARLAFLRNMQVYTSDEERVKSTAKVTACCLAAAESSCVQAFLLTTAMNNVDSSVESIGVTTVHANDGTTAEQSLSSLQRFPDCVVFRHRMCADVQAFLDDTSAGAAMIVKAKQKIKALLSSNVSGQRAALSAEFPVLTCLCQL
jgi:hypothetical protein